MSYTPHMGGGLLCGVCVCAGGSCICVSIFFALFCFQHFRTNAASEIHRFINSSTKQHISKQLASLNTP